MSKQIKIVLIEDDLDDVELLQENLDAHGIHYTLSVIKDGSAALQFCDNSDFLPDIIIMDFNLPKVHGREVITRIRSDKRFANVPILILSTSSAMEDINYAYKVGADKYQVKPATLEAIRQTIDTIVQLATTKNVSVSN